MMRLSPSLAWWRGALTATALVGSHLQAQQPVDFNQILAKAQAGDVTAETMAGLAFCNGIGVQKDYQQGFTWLQKAAHDNSPAAMSALGWLYENGLGVPLDYKQAFQWYLAGAKAGDSNGEEAVGECYVEGKGVDKDPAQAIAWFTKAAAQSNPIAQTHLAFAYQNGSGVPKDSQKAFTYFLQAASRKYGPAEYGVALCYWYGLFVPRDPIKAYAWCTLAVHNTPDKQAQDLLQQMIAALSGAQLEQGDALVDSLNKQQAGGLSAAPVAAFAANNRAKIPFQNVIGHIVITAQINGHANLHFMIDSGASASFLDERTANTLNIHPGDTYATGSGIGKDLLLSAVTNPLQVNLPGLTLNNISFRLLSTAQWDGPIGLHLDGIIGIDILRHYGIRIDYRRRTIEFVEPAALDVSHAGDPVPLEPEGSLILVEAKVVKFNVISNPSPLILDTGSNESITLSRNFLTANPGIRFTHGVSSYSLGGGGAVSESITRCSQLQLGNIMIKNPFVHLIMQNQGMWANGWEGSIGNEVLSRFDVTLDFPNKMLYLKPISHFGDTESQDGLVVQPTGWIRKSYVVTSILPNTPAAQAGWQKGDALVQIDNVAVKSLSLEDSCALLRQPGVHHVVVERRGKKVELVFQKG